MLKEARWIYKNSKFPRLTSSVLNVLVGLLFSLNAQAEMTVGAEFEFIDRKSPNFISSGLKGFEADMARRYVEAVKLKCFAPECKETLVKGKWGMESRFELANGFWFQVSWDPNVVEILTKPTKLSVLNGMAPQAQEYIFKTAQEAGLDVDPKKRAGHFNFGAHSSFKSNPTEFLKFVVDFANRPELSLGILRDPNLLNAPTLANLQASQREALSKIASDMLNPAALPLQGRHATFKNPYEVAAKRVSEMTLPELSSLLLATVFDKSSRPDLVGTDPGHHQALGLKKVPESRKNKDAPVEIRSVRSQRDIWDFLLLAEMIEARIKYLKKLTPENALLVTETKRTDFSRAELVNRFYIYLSEAGLSWERYSRLLPEELLKSEKISEVLVGKGKFKSPASMTELMPLLDLIPTSPWLQKHLSSALQSGRIPSEHRQQIVIALQKYGGDTSYSTEARKIFVQFEQIAKQEIVMSCAHIFN